MRRIKKILIKAGSVAMVFSLLGASVVVKADDVTNAPSLVISQLKVTSSNGQMVVLYNTTNNALDISKYQLEYFNSYDLAKATSSRLIALSGTLPPHGYYMLSDDTLQLCYTAIVSSASLGFSSTSGYLGVLGLSQSMPGGVVSPHLEDYVGWSRVAATGAQTLPVSVTASLLRQPFDAQNRPDISAAGNGTWLSVKPDALNPCNLVTSVAIPKNIATGMSELLPSTEPPFTIVEDDIGTEANSSGTISQTANNNKGLMSPKLTELLPNPIGTGNDSSDEFIEIYNPNPTTFDLSGYTLNSGSTTVHSYSFPPGTKLSPLSFTAFYSSTTKLSLSNTLSQVSLNDAVGNLLSETDVYSNAKDGQSWILANGAWVWSITPTPNMANILHAPSVKKSSKSNASKSAAKKQAKVGATKQSKSPKVLGATTSSSFLDAPHKTPIHAWSLALVGSLAILYAIYEFRYDIANMLHKLRRNYQAWIRSRK